MSELPPLLQEVQALYPARELIVDGVRWQLRDTAPGSEAVPLVLLPGALGTGDVFYQLLAALGAEHRLLSLTFPPLPSARAMANSLVRVLDALELPAVDLLGTSLGGYVAQLAAISHPRRFRKMVLANTFYDAGLQQLRWPPVAEYADIPVDVLLAAARQQLENGAEPTPEHAELKRVMLSLVGAAQDGAAVRAMRLAVLTAGVLERVPLADTAITLIDDDNDPVIAAPTREQMRERYRGCRHIRIAGGGHFPSNLRPAEYEAAVRSVLQASATP